MGPGPTGEVQRSKSESESCLAERHWRSAADRCQALEKCRKSCLEEALGKCSAQVSRTGEVQEVLS